MVGGLADEGRMFWYGCSGAARGGQHVFYHFVVCLPFGGERLQRDKRRYSSDHPL